MNGERDAFWRAGPAAGCDDAGEIKAAIVRQAVHGGPALAPGAATPPHPGWSRLHRGALSVIPEAMTFAIQGDRA